MTYCKGYFCKPGCKTSLDCPNNQVCKGNKCKENLASDSNSESSNTSEEN